jgi:kumamolisin
VRQAGIRTSSHRGDVTVELDGTARAVERLFGVHLFRYAAPNGFLFYAADGDPVLPPALRRAVVGVAGLDDFGRLETQAITPGGVTPADILSFYDIAPLRKAGLSGAGETVVFPELASPKDNERLRSDLEQFAKTFDLPPFDVTIRTDPAWHAPAKSNLDGLGEADLDLEIVHAIAPGAKLVVYEAGSAMANLASMQTAIAREHPKAIVSESLGGCELAVAHTVSELKAVQAPWVRQGELNMTHFVASGDTGAYTCGQDKPAAVAFPADLPVVTAVGGTSVLLAKTGGYYDELAWGNALSKSGGGGGATRLYSRPSYQTGKGIPGGKARLVPDVSALADENTGWNIVTDGRHAMIGGTSAAAPLWAGLGALINQDLKRRHLGAIGVANPAIYWIAAHRPAAFHDVTAGNNLLYSAHAGWDEATGWGTPDGAKLAAAWRAYAAQARR